MVVDKIIAAVQKTNEHNVSLGGQRYGTQDVSKLEEQCIIHVLC